VQPDREVMVDAVEALMPSGSTSVRTSLAPGSSVMGGSTISLSSTKSTRGSAARSSTSARRAVRLPGSGMRTISCG